MREFQPLVGATLYLMSRHAESRSTAVAEAVVRHLESLGSHPMAASLVREWSTDLARDWRSLAAGHREPRP